MEKPINTCKQEKKKMTVNIGGGGFGGVVLWGGALVTATLVTAFAIKRRGRSNNNHQSPPPVPTNPPSKLNSNDNSNEDEVSKGLRFLLPDSSTPIQYQPSCNEMTKMGVNQMDSTSMVSTQSLISDEKAEVEIKGGKEAPTYGSDEILFSDTPRNPESSPLFDDSGINAEESSLPMFGDSSLLLTPKNVMKNEPKEEIEVMKEDEAIEAAHPDQISVEDNQEMRLNIEEEQEEEYDDDHDGEIIVKKCEEGVETSYADQIAVGVQLSEEQEMLTDVDQEIICSASSIPESNPFKNHGVNLHEFSLSACDSTSLFRPENVKKNDSTETPLSVEANEVMKGDEAIEVAHEDQIIAEDNSQVQLINEEEQKGKKYDREIIVEKLCVVVETAQAYQIAVEDGQQMQLSEEQDVLANDDREIFCLDEPIPESNQFEDYGINVKEFSLPVLDTPSLFKPGNVDTNETAEAPLSTMEAVKVMKENEAIEVAHAHQISVEDMPATQLIEKVQKEDSDDDGRENTVEKVEEAVETIHADMVALEDNPQMQLSEKEEESDEDDDDIAGKVEEGSEGTGDSSMDSNAEAVWPVESMQEFSLEFKDLKINNHKMGEDVEKDTTAKTEDHASHKIIENGNMNADGQDITEDEGKLTMSYSQRYMLELATENNQATNSSKLKIWMWSMLPPVWCLCFWCFGLPFVKLCLIILLILILSKFQKV